MKKITQTLLYLTILALPFYIFRFNVGPIPSTVLEVLIYAAFLAALFSGAIGKIKNRKAVVWGGVFAAAALLAVCFDPDKTRSLGIWKAYFFDGYLLFLVVLSCADVSRREIPRALIGSGVLVSLSAVAMYFIRGGTVDHRLFDLDRLSPNYLAMYLLPIFAFAVILSFNLVISRRSREIPLRFLALARNDTGGRARNDTGERARNDTARLLSFVGICVIAAALILTGSRGALVAAAAAAIIGLYKIMRRRTQANWILKTVFALIFIIFLGAAFYVFRPNPNDLGRTGQSSNIRYYIWSASLEIAREKPVFGVGLSNYQDYFTNLTRGKVNYPEYISPHALTAHNLYLHLYLTMGILGLLAFIGLVAGNRFWRFSDPAASIALVVILFYGLVDTPLMRNDLAGLFWIIMALIYAANSQNVISTRAVRRNLGQNGQ